MGRSTNKKPETGSAAPTHNNGDEIPESIHSFPRGHPSRLNRREEVCRRLLPFLRRWKAGGAGSHKVHPAGCGTVRVHVTNRGNVLREKLRRLPHHRAEWKKAVPVQPEAVVPKVSMARRGAAEKEYQNGISIAQLVLSRNHRVLDSFLD